MVLRMNVEEQPDEISELEPKKVHQWGVRMKELKAGIEAAREELQIFEEDNEASRELLINLGGQVEHLMIQV